jgi:hypothetical protein
VLSGVTLCAVGGLALLSAFKPSPARPPSFERAATPNNLNYNETLAQIEAKRFSLAMRFRTAGPTERTTLIKEARTLVTQSVYNDLFPAWYGTAWDFNGTSETPQQGKIACGYFVSTVLRDAGWKVERVRLAQQASENIILSLTTNPFVKRFRRVPVDKFVAAVEDWGSGIYIVGLDVHVGFIVNTGADVYFIHSSYVDPYKVIKEKAIESSVLASSNYRVLGNILADDGFITNWLEGKAIATKGAQR